ncbi:hypothetical protein ARAM_003180 [Aspergillus rambellii]|uniref:CENP-V/GFA domain-containing protein n=1 Tax=Aspergillus rambellii TaxID=308745 RepID=A0A0F8VPX3_9EURO|nr:hypothetical protein ARAM_003180 [Aspergillus rambellii]
MAQKTLTGACLCGKITYTIDLPATELNPKVIICHCTSCKRYTGSGFSTNIIVPKSSLRYTSGIPKVFLDPTPDRGGECPRHFCGDCGSHFTSSPQDTPEMYAVKSGTLDEEHRKACGELALEIYCKRRDIWVDSMADEQVRRLQ